MLNLSPYSAKWKTRTDLESMSRTPERLTSDLADASQRRAETRDLSPIRAVLAMSGRKVKRNASPRSSVAQVRPLPANIDLGAGVGWTVASVPTAAPSTQSTSRLISMLSGFEQSGKGAQLLLNQQVRLQSPRKASPINTNNVSISSVSSAGVPSSGASRLQPSNAVALTEMYYLRQRVLALESQIAVCRNRRVDPTGRALVLAEPAVRALHRGCALRLAQSYLQRWQRWKVSIVVCRRHVGAAVGGNSFVTSYRGQSSQNSRLQQRHHHRDDQSWPAEVLSDKHGADALSDPDEERRHVHVVADSESRPLSHHKLQQQRLAKFDESVFHLEREQLNNRVHVETSEGDDRRRLLQHYFASFAHALDAEKRAHLRRLEQKAAADEQYSAKQVRDEREREIRAIEQQRVVALSLTLNVEIAKAHSANETKGRKAIILAYREGLEEILDRMAVLFA